MQVYPRPLDVESGVRVACDVDYMRANFGIARPLYSRVIPGLRDRQTSDAHHRLMSPPYGAGHKNTNAVDNNACSLRLRIL